MGLICYVLYLPVKELAYYLNTGYSASDSLGARNDSSPSYAPSLEPGRFLVRGIKFPDIDL